MEKVLHIARSFEEADARDREYYRSLTPEQRIAILIELNDRMYGITDDKPAPRLQRVFKIIRRT